MRILLFLCVLAAPNVAVAQRPDVPPALNATFAAGAFWRTEFGEQGVSGMVGFEAALGRGNVQPTIAVFYGGDQGSIEVGAKAFIRTTSGGNMWAGGGVAAYNYETYRVLARLGYEDTRRKDFGLGIEGRIYALPLEPAVIVGLTLPATRR